MTSTPPSLLSRISLAIGSFFAIIADPRFAARVLALRDGASHGQGASAAFATTSPTTAAPAAAEPKHAVASPLRAATPDAALQLLGLLQREARFVDFIEEDVAAYADADVGNAARVVHEGCRKVLRDYFTITPVRAEAEGSKVTLVAGFDAAAIRVTGNVVGQPPFTGSVAHRGWRVDETRLPRIASAHDLAILAPAEVEL